MALMALIARGTCSPLSLMLSSVAKDQRARDEALGGPKSGKLKAP